MSIVHSRKKLIETNKEQTGIIIFLAILCVIILMIALVFAYYDGKRYNSMRCQLQHGKNFSVVDKVTDTPLRMNCCEKVVKPIIDNDYLATDQGWFKIVPAEVEPVCKPYVEGGAH